MSKLATIGTLAAIVLLSSGQAHADLRTSLRRGTLTVTGTRAGSALHIDEYEDTIVVRSVSVSRSGLEVEESESFPADEVSNVSVRTGTHSVAVVNLQNGQNLTVRGGGSAEVILVSGYYGDVSISSGGGNDYVAITEMSADGETDIRTGGGHDYCFVSNCEFFGDVDVAMGTGDDDLFIGGSDFCVAPPTDDDEPVEDEMDIDIRLNGNGGTDLWVFEGNSLDLSEFVVRFENEDEDEDEDEEEEEDDEEEEDMTV